MDSKQVISPEQDYHGKDSKEVNNTKQIDQTLVSDHSVDKFDPSKLCTKADIGSGDLSKQIHIGNLPFNLHPEDVYNYFRPFGEIMFIIYFCHIFNYLVSFLFTLHIIIIAGEYTYHNVQMADL